MNSIATMDAFPMNPFQEPLALKQEQSAFSDCTSAVVDMSPLQPSDCHAQAPRRRRKREAIEIPDELAASCDPREVKKLKNRIAAARLRERSQQKIRDLEAEVAALRERNAYLESLAQSAVKYASPSVPCSPAVQCESPVTIDEGAAMTHDMIFGEFEGDLLHQLLWQSEELSCL
ncbi:hypothetical protein P43SY_005955 [Pythium insidiosum]|uniref:BZIP domain-containing protein n=1 Tax=Pythium insidiosum TaxID=114742 RepID=A0AAD5M0E7_PYTIN|nr:hypothetical protein P43SY_005955 [Pythium insidiosum]KAJ0401413.1 hypothetical protein ATCC90586_009989 [Pythium insidiosum]